MERKSFFHDGLTLSYLESGGSGPALIALHAHWTEAQTFAPLAAALASEAPEWRVIALDQRGHGDSSHARSYTRQDYLGDLLGLFEHLQIAEAVLLGNSLGGVNAYQFAAAYPERVRGLIVEDIGVEISDDIRFCLPWKGTFATREELAERVGARFLPYLSESFRSGPEGWRLAFDPEEMVRSEDCMHGDHWGDWLASTCPALVIRGRDSRVTSQEQLERMVERRENARLEVLPGGHVVHMDCPKEFAEVVAGFLGGV